MKYTLIALSALALWTGAASAAQKNWHCVDLKANWQHAPQMQCPQIYVESTHEIAPKFPPRETRVEVVDE